MTEDMIKADKFWGFLETKGYNFFSGVPCSILTPVLKGLNKRPGIKYIPAVKENAAIGIASGAYVSGRKGGILIQNSGLGNIINALTSFNLIYKVPLLIFITWRGYQGKDAPEHLIMGEKMLKLLDCLSLPHIILTDSYKRDLSRAIGILQARKIPVAVIVKKGMIE